jgi:ribokinase
MLTVFGSLNVDIAVRTPRLPRPGETMMAARAHISPGGKGANQAHAAALYGADAHMYGMVGADAFAPTALSQLNAKGVETSGVGAATGCETGLAVIHVDAAGENAIVVVPGANTKARAASVPDAVLSQSQVLLLQLEVPLDESMALARRARRAGCKVILNASPLPATFSLERDCVDMLVVNRGELEQLCAQAEIFGIDPMDRAVLASRTLGVDVLVTLGAEGAFLATASGQTFAARASTLPVLDTTGAGDTFAGVFAAALSLGQGTQDALEAASAAAGLACLAPGTQVAQPGVAAIRAELARRRTRLGEPACAFP